MNNEINEIKIQQSINIKFDHRKKESFHSKTSHLKLSMGENRKEKVKKAYGIYKTSLSIFIYYMHQSTKEEREGGAENLFKAKIAKNFPNLGRDINI